MPLPTLVEAEDGRSAMPLTVDAPEATAIALDATSEFVMPLLIAIALTVAEDERVNAPAYVVPLVDEGVVPLVVYLMAAP